MRATPARALPRLTPNHLTLYRAYLQGLDEATLHAHYGVPRTDARVTRRTFTTLCDTLTVSTHDIHSAASAAPETVELCEHRARRCRRIRVS
ncbi:hypothetical protein [Burkholderia cenocepacia]|uniref:hypothetical protein n=1 Tax=Burkholderia cenocepacia TaxID=95486 RepID=UPI00286F2D9E|nr:hypothetical protein [Burkholderia cenocepacia]